MKSKNSIEVHEEVGLRWPEGWERTRVDRWKTNASWKKSRTQYTEALIKELTAMGAQSVLITRSSNERLDPGVAVWFSMAKDNRDWQDLLGIDSPAPTLDEIDHAFRKRAMPHHPDRIANDPGGDGDIAIWQKLKDARDAAKAWVLGTHDKRHEFVMALDLFNEQRLNLAGLRLAFANLRSLKRLGMPSILERTLNKAFKAALPMGETA